jgi:putative salt-induced outer membrane protein YdiY
MKKLVIKPHLVIVYIVLFFLLLTALTSKSQSVMNVETMRLAFDSTDNWIGSVEFGGLYQAEIIDQSKLEIATATHIGFKKEKHLMLFMGSFVYEMVGKFNVENKYNLHLRYNYRLTKNKRLFLETFGQMQHNHQIDLTRRDLVGTGIRYLLVKSPKFKMNVGTLAMYEYQVISDSIYHNDIRSSSYLFMGIPITSDIHVLSTTYYQPLFIDFSNYRLSSELTLDMSISKVFSFVISYVFYYDTQIEKEVPTVDIPTDLLTMSFKIKF